MNAEDLGQKINSLIREGEVTQIFPDRMTARVTFSDRDDNVSAELKILTQGSSKNKSYFNYDIGTQVLCLFAANDETSGTGWIVGSTFNDVDKVPEGVDENTKRVEFADGSYVSYNHQNHEMKINCKGTLEIDCEGDITIKGRNIFLNE